MKEHGGHEKEDEKVKQKQAAELFRQGQQQLRKAQAAVGDQAVVEYDACAQLFTEAISLRPHHAQYYQARGRCYIAVQQYLRALGDFVVCCRIEPGIARHFAHRGQCFRRLGRVEEALKDYDEALRLERIKAEKDPSETHQRQAAEYYFERALVHIDLEQYDKAIEGFSQALDKRLAAPYKAFFHRGICYRRVGQIAESIQNLKEAINLDTTSADAHNHLGLSHIQEQNFEEARKCFANAVELDACARYLNNRGLASYHLEEYTDAAVDFTAALDAEPDNASVLFNRGNAYFQLGQHQEALDDYAEAIRLEPDNATYLHHKGLAYQGCGEVREAIACYEEALRRDPGHHPSRFHLGIMCHADGQYDRALEAFNGGVPPDEALHEARGLVYRDMGDYQTALVDFDAVIDLEPQRGRHYYNRGVVYHRMGREQDAIEDLSRAIDLGSTEAAVFSERGLAWRSFGNMAQAVIDLTAAIEADGTQTLYLSNRAQCLFEQGLYDRAEADLSRALQIDGRDAELLYRRGITRYAQRHYAESIADLKAALAQGPIPGHEAEVYYHLGVSYANLGKHQLAVPVYDQAISLAKGDRPHYLHERAKSLQIIGEHKRALDDFSRVIDLQPTNARAMFRRAFSFKAESMYEEAAEDFEAAKEFAPDDPRLVINYRKVYDVACISLGPCGHEVAVPIIINTLKKDRLSDPMHFQAKLWPALKPLFSAKEIPIEVVTLFLKELDLLVSLAPAAETQAVLLPFLLRCMELQEPTILNEVLEKVPYLHKKFEYRQVKDQILPRMLQLLGTAAPKVKVQVLMGLSRIFEIFDKNTIQDAVLPAFEKLTKSDRTPAICMCLLGCYDAMSKNLGPKVTAERILPLIMPLLAEEGLSFDQWETQMTVAKKLMQRVESARRKEYEARKDAQAESEHALGAQAPVAPPVQTQAEPQDFESLLMGPSKAPPAPAKAAAAPVAPVAPPPPAGNDLLGGGLLDKPTPSAPSTGLGDGFDPFAAAAGSAPAATPSFDPFANAGLGSGGAGGCNGMGLGPSPAQGLGALNMGGCSGLGAGAPGQYPGALPGLGSNMPNLGSVPGAPGGPGSTGPANLGGMRNLNYDPFAECEPGGCTSYMPFISDLALASPKVFLVGTIVEALLVGIWLQLAILSRQKLLMELKLLDEFELAHFLCAFSGKLVVIGTFLIGMFPWSHFSYSHFACACCVFWGGCGYSIATAVYVQSWRSTIARESHYPSAMTPVAASACLCFFGVFVSLCAAYDARPNFFDWNWWPKLQKLAREDFRAYCSASSWHGLPWVNTCAALEWLTLGILYVAMRAGLKTADIELFLQTDHAAARYACQHRTGERAAQSVVHGYWCLGLLATRCLWGLVVCAPLAMVMAFSVSWVQSGGRGLPFLSQFGTHPETKAEFVSGALCHAGFLAAWLWHILCTQRVTAEHVQHPKHSWFSTGLPAVPLVSASGASLMIVGLCFVACFRLDDHLAMHFCGLGCFLAGSQLWCVACLFLEQPDWSRLHKHKLHNASKWIQLTCWFLACGCLAMGGSAILWGVAWAKANGQDFIQAWQQALEERMAGTSMPSSSAVVALCQWAYVGYIHIFVACSICDSHRYFQVCNSVISSEAHKSRSLGRCCITAFVSCLAVACITYSQGLLDLWWRSAKAPSAGSLQTP
ncbi:TTC6 [Symbiodinium pilosum]|uniref:TTC6 protein n=1 Tax=Symbiodinium pilosum TaxID=2952 RepID=A0A812N1G7_SYMPI|nr:TTC6 [Symbiodinium pilosum]